MANRTLLDDEMLDSISGGNYLWAYYPGCSQVRSDVDSTGSVYDFSGHTREEVQAKLDELAEDYSEKAALAKLCNEGYITLVTG